VIPLLDDFFLFQSSKLVAANKEFFSEMVVSAVMSIEQDILPLEMIGIKKVPGGALEVSLNLNLVDPK